MPGQCVESERLEQSFLNVMSVLCPSIQGSGIFVEDKVERLQESESADDSRVITSARYNGTDA